MANYTVKTTDNRNLVIEADSYALDYTQTAYTFTKGDKTVATVPASPYVFAIVLDDNVESDHYYVYDWNEEDEKEAEIDEADDVCLGCRFKEFLESEEFFSEVWDIVEAYHKPECPEPFTVYTAITPNSEDGELGFWYHDDQKGDLFVPCGTGANGETIIHKLKNGISTHPLFTFPLSETTPVSETIQ